MSGKFDVFDSKFAQDIYLQKYSMDKQESWADTCRRVVTSVTGQLLPKEDQEIIYQIMLERKFIPGGRYLYSSGRPLHQVNNCFLFRAEDSREAWAEALEKTVSALMTGGGIGFEYSKLREEGALIKRTGGHSTGPIALMNMVNEAGRYIMQGGQRRSAIWGGLNWSHPDIKKFIKLKDWSPELKALKEKDFNFPLPMEGTNISVVYDTEFFIAIEDSKHPKHKLAKEVWTENCKQAFSTAEPGMAMNFRKDNENLRNACVTGETEILTDDGYKEIQTLVGQKVNIWNGFEWSEVEPKITGTNQEILTVTFSDGRVLNCTPYHKFHISTEFGTRTSIIEAKDLESGMKLIKHEFPVIEHGLELQHAYTRGVAESVSKSFVPLNYNLKGKLEWLSGLFYGTGKELKDGTFELVSIYRNFLLNLQKLLNTLGVQSKILNISTGSYRILIIQPETQKLKALGLKCEKMTFNKPLSPYIPHCVSVVDVAQNGIADVVYCFNEPKRHLGVFNGVITGQCTEVVSEDDSDKCNLGTIWINRIKDKEELAHVTKYSTMFLICGGIYSDVPHEKIKQVGSKNNRIGLGLGGIHEWLMVRGHDYEVTPELHKWLSVYEQESDAAAFITARNLGVSVPKGVRAIAPTGTIGIIAETTTGIEPLFCKSYKRRYLRGSEWVYQYVVDGSVKRLLALGVPLENIKDSYDLTFKQRVKFQADVQNYVDMSISSTCNLPYWGSDQNNEDTLKQNAKILLKYAKRLRGFTCYPDGSRGGQPLTRVELEEALANEGTVFEEVEDRCVGGVCGI